MDIKGVPRIFLVYQSRRLLVLDLTKLHYFSPALFGGLLSCCERHFEVGST